MPKKILIPAIFFSYLAVNYRWLRAASAAVVSHNSCDAELIESARRSVREQFGTVNSKPIIACVDRSLFGYKVSHGETNFTPGLPSVILIGSEGMETSVVAHEWAHAEFARRIGIINKVIFIPTWFDEGLAMQVDLRDEYNLEAYANYRLQNKYRSVELADISASEFYAAGDLGRYHYAFSRCVVGEWLQKNPNWLENLSNLGLDSPFPTEEFNNLCD